MKTGTPKPASNALWYSYDNEDGRTAVRPYESGIGPGEALRTGEGAGACPAGESREGGALYWWGFGGTPQPLSAPLPAREAGGVRSGRGARWLGVPEGQADVNHEVVGREAVG